MNPPPPPLPTLSAFLSHPFLFPPLQLKLGRLVAGWSIVWALEASIELLKEVACHPSETHLHLQALLPLAASLGWNGVLHVGLRHGRAATAQLKSAFARAASKLRPPARDARRVPSSPPPTPDRAAVKAAEAKAEAKAADDADEPATAAEASPDDS